MTDKELFNAFHREIAKEKDTFIEDVKKEVLQAHEDITSLMSSDYQFEQWKTRKGVQPVDKFYEDRYDRDEYSKNRVDYKFRSYKRYTSAQGLSSAFRNMALSPSHCAQNHGYALQFHLTFEATHLENNIVVDFGSLKSYLQMLKDNFDHMTLVAADDPELYMYYLMEQKGMANINVMPAIGCEAFAYFAYGALETWLESNGYSPRVRAVSVEVWEHESNGAAYGRFQ